MGTRLQTALLTLQEIAAGGVVVSTEKGILYNASACKIWIRFGRRATTALTAAINFRVEISPDTTGNRWQPVTTLSTQLGSSVATEAVNGVVAAGATVITVASTTGLVAGDVIYFEHTTPANSEWARIKAISVDTSVTVEEAIINTQTGATLFDQAEIYAPVSVDLKGVSRVRVVCDGSGGGQAYAVEAIMEEWG